MNQPSLRPLLLPCMMIGAFTVLVTFVDDAQSIWPISLGSANWRFGTLGFMIGTGALPVLGIGLVVLAAALGEYRKMTWVAAGAALVIGVVVLAGMAVFFADARTVMASAGGGDAGAILAGAMRRTLAIGALTGPAYVAIGLAGVRIARSLPAAGARSPLVVGRSGE